MFVLAKGKSHANYTRPQPQLSASAGTGLPNDREKRTMEFGYAGKGDKEENRTA